MPTAALLMGEEENKYWRQTVQGIRARRIEGVYTVGAYTHRER